ncbi:MAG: hypothetical protein WD467_00375 [Candidatus Saccharimonadales bacterium]
MDSHLVLIALHLLGFAFGVGGATASDAIFVRSVKDGKVTRSEYNILKTVSIIVWTSVTILILSGTLLMLLELQQGGDIPRLGFSFFQLKLTAFALLVANGVVFHFRVFPLLKSTIGQSFREEGVRHKYWLFALTGGISIVSWYTAFLAVAFSSVLIDYPYLFLLNIYGLLICGAALSAYLVLHSFAMERGLVWTLSTIYRHPFVVKMVLVGLLLVSGLLAQGYELFLT